MQHLFYFNIASPVGDLVVGAFKYSLNRAINYNAGFHGDQLCRLVRGLVARRSKETNWQLLLCCAEPPSRCRNSPSVKADGLECNGDVVFEDLALGRVVGFCGKLTGGT